MTMSDFMNWGYIGPQVDFDTYLLDLGIYKNCWIQHLLSCKGMILLDILRQLHAIGILSGKEWWYVMGISSASCRMWTHTRWGSRPNPQDSLAVCMLNRKPGECVQSLHSLLVVCPEWSLSFFDNCTLNWSIFYDCHCESPGSSISPHLKCQPLVFQSPWDGAQDLLWQLLPLSQIR